MTEVGATSFHNIVKNIDYSLRIKNAKYILVTSDFAGEGKSTFLAECTPYLSSLYERKILIYDCQPERNDLLESVMKHQKEFQGVDYLHHDDLNFLKEKFGEEKLSAMTTHFTEMARDYDLVFINMKTLKRSEKTQIPPLPIDGAIVVRTNKSIGSKNRFITNEILDREIPIIGLVRNGGV